ncbi:MULTISPECIES: KamA family radical SAM protein [unclassified Nostoc]|uniref:KamA family radical SAM protein n=1 Tax=unclassified Nostoc TaxID=2593658 RepID=UPI0021AB434D|nr:MULTISPECIES: KamA family radical SAM protein [unclassified Nostoc]
MQILLLWRSEYNSLVLIAPEKFAVAVTPYFASLLDPEDPFCPLCLQVIPRKEELIVSTADMVDPCGEDHDSPVPGLVHRYPDRVLLLALDTCAAYCRYCTRSRLVSQGEMYPVTRRLDAIAAYLEEHTEIRDVLISGGDPLLMSDEPLDNLLGRLRAIKHIEFIRIGSRVPSFLPQRITPELVAMLRKHRVWLSLHFCHLPELAPEVAQACEVMEFDDEETIIGLEAALFQLGHQVERIGNGRELALHLAKGDRWDLVFNIAEGVQGRSREAQVPAVCELFAQPYTFSDPLTCALTLDKALAKRVVRDLKLGC